jgi:pyridoxamine-phosphate oxidase
MSTQYEEFQALRREYIQKVFSEEEASLNPLEQFGNWFDEAKDKSLDMPNAMTLSTVSASGQPSSRVVLLKHYDEEGFRFFTNYDSRKSQDMLSNPKISLLFYWSLFDRQVRIEGEVTKTSREESESYFKSRPLDSQISAVISAQSSVVPDRHLLEKAFEEKKSTPGDSVDLPDNWGGFIVKVKHYEFWQGRENRLHDRLVYEQDGTTWKRRRLAP